MAKMIGSLQHLGGTHYRIRIYAGTDMLGHQRTRSKSFDAPTLKAAEKMAPKITAALQADVDGRRARAGTMAGVVDEWLDLKRHGGASPSTIASYNTHARRITERFGRLAPGDVTARLIDQWYADLRRQGMSDANILHHHATLRMVLRQAERYGMVTSVATRMATPPKRVAPTHTLPTAAALGVLMSSTRGTVGTALHLVAATGLRRGELVGLQWPDLDGRWLTVRRSILELDGGGWVAKTTKTGRVRRVELDDATAAMLADHAEACAAAGAQLGALSPWMFPNWREDTSGRTPYRPGWLSGWWGKLRRQHGLAGCRLHDLRHWHASTLLRRGVDVVEVADRLGHAQTSTTLNIYGHVLPDKSGRAPGAIAAALGELPAPIPTPDIPS